MVNQRMLNGGEQGEGSGLDADTVDAKESGDLSSEFGKNVSLSEYRSLMNKLVSESAENSFEVGLQGINYPDGFFDVFVDSNKVSSQSNVTVSTGTNGNIKLSGNNTGSVSISSEEGIQDRPEESGIEINPNEDLESVECTLTSNFNTLSNSPTAYLEDSSSNTLATVDLSGFSGGDTFTFNQSLSSGNNYLIYIYAGGSDFRQTFHTDNSPYNSQYIDITDGYFDGGLNTKQRNIKSVTATTVLKANGSITSTTNDLGYQASEVTVTADYSLNGQSIDSIKIFDGADTELASFSESEIGTVKTISASRTDYYAEINLSGGTDTPKVNSYEVALDDQ